MIVERRVERGTQRIEKEKQRDDPERADAKDCEQAACRELEREGLLAVFPRGPENDVPKHDHQRRDPRDQRRAMQGAGR